MSNVQISSDLWEDLLYYFLGEDDIFRSDTSFGEIQRKISEKYLALERRKTFSQYKLSSPGSHQRELLRQEYLNQVGITRSYRSDTEYPEEIPPD